MEPVRLGRFIRTPAGKRRRSSVLLRSLLIEGENASVPPRDTSRMPTDDYPHVVIVGAGFGGLACAAKLGGTNIRVTIIDRNNYHLFVPLLYQVATAALPPADIAEPVRKS
jgi:NADPH-dependent 2,4-dienoyl-CoA reductase/sulfur reductase-like enzyme